MTAVTWRIYEFNWIDFPLVTAGFMAVMIIVFDRSFSIAIAYSAAALFTVASVSSTIFNTNVPLGNLGQLSIVATFDLLAVIALGFSWYSGHIHPSKADWLAAAATTVIMAGLSVLLFLISLAVPWRLEAFSLVVLIVGGGNFVWLRRRFSEQHAPVQ